MDEGKLIGIITESEVFAALASLTGVKDGGIEIELELPDTPTSCKAEGDIIRENGLMIRSLPF
jgi:acetoin utilization protein AcuB